MPGLALGAADVKKVAFGSLEVQKASLGDALIWQAVTFLPSRMTKTGTQSITASWTTVAGWSPDTTNYPGSTVVSNALQAQGPKTDATITASLPFTGGFSYPRRVRILVNGVVVATGPEVAAMSGTLTATTSPIGVLEGDDVTVEVIAQFANGAVSAGGSVTIS